jgi:hypothetical protein
MNTRLVVPISLAAGALVIACSTSKTNGAQYGEEITLTDTTLVSDILADPASFVGETVLVAGTVVEVCEMRGCWLELASDKEFERIRVKVEDGVIIFPMSARGHRAVVEGIVEELQLTLEEAIERAQHHAEEHGLEFDPSTVTGPETILQLKGLGAIIEE